MAWNPASRICHPQRIFHRARRRRSSRRDQTRAQLERMLDRVPHASDAGWSLFLAIGHQRSQGTGAAVVMAPQEAPVRRRRRCPRRTRRVGVDERRRSAGGRHPRRRSASPSRVATDFDDEVRTVSRFDRQESFFGKAGQEKLRHASVAIVGVGGLGTHVAQQLALLGIGKLALIDHEELSETNRNRYVSARHDDPIPGSPKVLLGERMVKAFNPDVIVETVPYELCSPQAFEAVNASDFVMGCLDSAGPRLVLTELCAAYSRPYFDLATEIHPGEPLVYGGHVCFSNGEGCLVCLEELDVAEAQRDLATPEAQAERRRIYGVEHQDLAESCPSVVSLNGVVASLCVTEL